MKSLKTVMTITKIFRILAIIATVFVFLGAGACFLSALIINLVKNEPDFIDGIRNIIEEVIKTYKLSNTATPSEVIKIMLAATVFYGVSLIGNGVCLLLSAMLLNTAVKQGTPFCKPVVKTARTYGIAFIVVTVAVSIIAAIIGKVIANPYALNASANYTFIAAGIALIITSFFIDYGADLRAAADSVPPASADYRQPQNNETDNDKENATLGGNDLFD